MNNTSSFFHCFVFQRKFHYSYEEPIFCYIITCHQPSNICIHRNVLAIFFKNNCVFIKLTLIFKLYVCFLLLENLLQFAQSSSFYIDCFFFIMYFFSIRCYCTALILELPPLGSTVFSECVSLH